MADTLDDDSQRGGGEDHNLERYRAKPVESRFSIGKPTDEFFNQKFNAVIDALVRHFYPDVRTHFDGITTTGGNEDATLYFSYLGTSRAKDICELFVENSNNCGKAAYDHGIVEFEVSEGDARENVASTLDAVIKTLGFEKLASAAVQRAEILAAARHAI